MTKLAYIGTVAVLATPLTRGEYNKHRNWDTPVDENPNDEGYLLENKLLASNHAEHGGYISWLPKDAFEKLYKLSGTVTFGDALALLKAGHRVQRAGWNGKGMYLLLIKGQAITASINDCYGNPAEALPVLDAIYMKTADNKLVPWLASQTDMLSEDWSTF